MPIPLFLSDFAAKLVNDDAFQAYGKEKAGGQASTGIMSKLGDLQADDLFNDPVTDASMAQCCLSGLWLLHNCLDRSHSISQDIDSAEGSYWHGIMHRMEGDFGNSKYWFGRVGQHPVFEMLNQQTPGGWNYRDFVDACEAAKSSCPPDPQVHQTAVAEWVALFEHCGTKAIA